jgi:mono/diheme cytochrome c family protein
MSAVKLERPPTLPGAVCAMLAMTWLAACAGSPSNRAEAHDIDRGKRLYATACASCHGADARGRGPVAPLLGARPPDLTLITSRHGGTFPADHLFQLIDGQADLSAHGPRHMPVWGYEFFGKSPDDEVAHRQATRKIEQLVSYLRSIQRTN